MQKEEVKDIALISNVERLTRLAKDGESDGGSAPNLNIGEQELPTEEELDFADKLEKLGNNQNEMCQ